MKKIKIVRRYSILQQPSFDLKSRILFEDNHLLVIVKPSGLLSQGDSTGDPSLLDLAKQYLVKSRQKLGDAYLGLVHRIDRPCSGVIVFAKTSKAASRLSESFRDRYVDKHYVCVVNGIMSNRRGHFINLIEKTTSQKVGIIQENHTNILSSVEGRLCYEVISENTLKNQSVLHIELETGRKHQIRAQLSHAGHPIVGDAKYNAPQRFKERGNISRYTNNISRYTNHFLNFCLDIALHSCTLVLMHPISKQTMVFSSPVPDIWKKRFGDTTAVAVDNLIASIRLKTAQNELLDLDI